jgi:hypothetical protein
MLLVLAVLFAAAAPVVGKAPPHQPTEVEGVTVMPLTPMPKLVSSSPANGEAVAPGALIVRLTFDQKMSPTTFDVAPAADADAPDCLKTPRLLDDEKTFVLLCTTRAGRPYGLTLNGKGTGGFANRYERRADAASISFTTTRDDPVRNLGEAMKVAKLTGLEVPIAVSPEQ